MWIARPEPALVFRRAWQRACARLGAKEVDLYSGVKHNTITALGQFGFSLKSIKIKSRHKTITAALLMLTYPRITGPGIAVAKKGL